MSHTLAIFMATYNGELYLAEQIDSILNQSHKNIKIVVSDDGSTDNTLNILADYQNLLGSNHFLIEKGPQKGYAVNFLSLISKSNAFEDYYAYSDQDDIWEQDKLDKAIDWLSSIPVDTPALFCSRTKIVNVEGIYQKDSLEFKSKPCFLNALVQNIAGGNTMVFNRAALLLLQRASKDINVVAHDWWTYLLISGANGAIFYDLYPAIKYRQHTQNLIGANQSWSARIKRITGLFNGHYKQWISLNTQALLACVELLHPKNQLILKQFVSTRNKGLLSRVIKMKKIGIFRQTLLGNLGLIAAICFKKI